MSSLSKEFRGTLKPHQEEAFQQLHCRKRALLSDKAGKGKTLTALFSWYYLHKVGVVNKMFVVVPVNAYTKKVWQKEVKLHFSGVTSISFDEVSNYTTTQLMSLPHDIVVLKYTSCKFKDQVMYRLINSLFLNAPQGKMNVVLFDEVHKLKSWDSQTTQIWRACTKNVPIIWGLTATAYSKDYADTYHIINFIKPYVLGTFGDFKRHCCIVEEYFQPGAGYLERIVGLHQDVFFGKLNGLLIRGENHVIPHFNFYRYEMSNDTRDLYLRVANGLASFPVQSGDETTQKDFLRRLLSEDSNPELPFSLEDYEETDLLDISKNSAGYVYLQYVVDGAVNSDGEFKPTPTMKLDAVLSILQDIYSRGRSCVIYAHYYYSLDVIMEACRQVFPQAVLMENSSRNRLGENDLRPENVAKRPHFVFITQAGSESLSWGFISDLLFFNTPTTPSLFSQVAGRILRINTLFMGDLHLHIPLSNNIDGYKLLMCSAKASQADKIQGEDLSIPAVFKGVDFSNRSWEQWKSQLLWGARGSTTILDI